MKMKVMAYLGESIFSAAGGSDKLALANGQLKINEKMMK